MQGFFVTAGQSGQIVGFFDKLQIIAVFGKVDNIFFEQFQKETAERNFVKGFKCKISQQRGVAFQTVFLPSGSFLHQFPGHEVRNDDGGESQKADDNVTVVVQKPGEFLIKVRRDEIIFVHGND